MSQAQLMVISASTAAFAEALEYAKLNEGDANFKPLGIDPGTSIQFLDSASTSHEGWAADGRAWLMIVRTTYTNGTAGTPVIVYRDELGNEQSSVPNGFVLGNNPHGQAISIAFTPTVASLPTTDNTNLIGGANVSARYNRITGSAVLSVDATISFKTAKNTNTQTYRVAASTGEVKFDIPLSAGDYLTYFNVYSAANTGTMAIGLTGYKAAISDVVIVNLQGAWRGSEMGTELRNANLVPLTDPYSLSTTASSLSADVVDWVKVDYSTDGTTWTNAQAALVYKNGWVYGSTGALLTSPVTGNYYVRIAHRNHLPIRSASLLPLTTGQTFGYNFGGAQAQAYQNSGVTSNAAQAALSGGKFGLWAGNVNGNTNVRLQGPSNDYSAIITIATTLTGSSTGVATNVYSNGDVNMDGTMNANDTVPAANTASDIYFIQFTPLGGNQATIINQHL